MAKYKRADIIAALERNGGMVYLAARALRCSPQTIYNYRDKYPDVAQAIDQARGELVDTAELALKRAVIAGEGWAVCFTLKTIGKSRGYTEAHEVKQEITLDVNDARERLAQLIARQAERGGADGAAGGTES